MKSYYLSLSQNRDIADISTNVDTCTRKAKVKSFSLALALYPNLNVGFYLDTYSLQFYYNNTYSDKNDMKRYYLRVHIWTPLVCLGEDTYVDEPRFQWAWLAKLHGWLKGAYINQDNFVELRHS